MSRPTRQDKLDMPQEEMHNISGPRAPPKADSPKDKDGSSAASLPSATGPRKRSRADSTNSSAPGKHKKHRGNEVVTDASQDRTKVNVEGGDAAADRRGATAEACDAEAEWCDEVAEWCDEVATWCCASDIWHDIADIWRDIASFWRNAAASKRYAATEWLTTLKLENKRL